MRLIDADLFLKSIKVTPQFKGDIELLERCVEHFPTAFDLESVIAELWELKTYKLGMADAMAELMKRDKLGTYVCLEDAIEILKSTANATNGKIGG